MNFEYVAKEVRRKNPKITFFRVQVLDVDGGNVIQVEDAEGNVLHRYGEGYGLDSIGIEELEEWGPKLAEALAVKAVYGSDDPNTHELSDGSCLEYDPEADAIRYIDQHGNTLAVYCHDDDGYGEYRGLFPS